MLDTVCCVLHAGCVLSSLLDVLCSILKRVSALVSALCGVLCVCCVDSQGIRSLVGVKLHLSSAAPPMLQVLADCHPVGPGVGRSLPALQPRVIKYHSHTPFICVHMRIIMHSSCIHNAFICVRNAFIMHSCAFVGLATTCILQCSTHLVCSITNPELLIFLFQFGQPSSCSF